LPRRDEQRSPRVVTDFSFPSVLIAQGHDHLPILADDVKVA
jgi:hypothetical protein